MKKYLLLFSALLLISACGSNEAVTTEETDVNENEAVEQEEETNEDLDEFVEENDVKLDEDGFFVETTDPLEAGNKNNGIVVYNDDFGYTYIIKEWYTNEMTNEDGFNQLDFDGYNVEFAVALIEDSEENDMIGFFVETENETDKVVQYNMDMEIITDQQEQVDSDSMYGIGESKPGIKTKGFVKVDLDYEAPEEMTIIFEPPWDDEDEFNEEIGDPIELKFTKE